MSDGLSYAAKLAAVVIVAMIVGMVAGALTSCAPTPSHPLPDRWRDAEATAEERSASPDACHRAGVNLKAACPKLWREDWDAFCRAMEKNGVPICAVKLARAKSCAEADAVCR